LIRIKVSPFMFFSAGFWCLESVPQRGSVWHWSQYHNAVACGSFQAK